MQFVDCLRNNPRIAAAFVAFVGWVPICLASYPLFIKKPVTTAIVFLVPAILSMVLAALLFGPWAQKPTSFRVLKCCGAGLVCSVGTMLASGIITHLALTVITGSFISLWRLTIDPLLAGIGMLVMGSYLTLGIPHILAVFGGAVVAKLVRPVSDMPSN